MFIAKIAIIAVHSTIIETPRETGTVTVKEKILLVDSLHKEEGLEVEGRPAHPARVSHLRAWRRHLGEILCIADARDARLLSGRGLR